MATTPRLKFSELDESSLAKLKRFEEQVGGIVLAVSPVYPIATLTPEQLNRVQTMERELGVVLIAYKQ